MAADSPAFGCGHPKDRLVSEGGNISRNGLFQRCATCAKAKKVLARAKLKMEQERKKEDVIRGQLSGIRALADAHRKNRLQFDEWSGYFVSAIRTMQKAGCDQDEIEGLRSQVVDRCMRSSGNVRPHKNGDRAKFDALVDGLKSTWDGAVAYVFGDVIEAEEVAINSETSERVRDSEGKSPLGSDTNRILELVDGWVMNPNSLWRPKNEDGTLKYTNEQWKRIVFNHCKDTVRSQWDYLSEEQKLKYSRFRPTK